MEETELIHFKPKSWLKPPRQRRLKFDRAELLRLAENIAATGMQNPVVCLESGEIVSGDRRWSASMLDDRILTVPVRIVNDPLTAKELRIRRISENLHRQDVTAYERCLECEGFRDDEPSITAKEMAELLSVDPSTITRYLSLADCIEEVRQALKEERIGIKAVYEIAKAPAEDQLALLADALIGGADAATKARRKPAKAVPAARPGKIKVVLGSGVVVTVGGSDGLTLEEAISELAEALAEMRKAEKQGLDAKTFMAVCRDKAKAGA